MGKIQVQIKAPFGEIVVEGASASEILATLKAMPPQFMNEIGSLIDMKLTPPIQTQLNGIVEFTTEGPIITTREKLTHYEAIGLVLFAADEKVGSTAKITQCLAASGIKSMVPARLNEMTKRGMVFKPNPSESEFKLTAQGERWIEDEVMEKLR